MGDSPTPTPTLILHKKEKMLCMIMQILHVLVLTITNAGPLHHQPLGKAVSPAGGGRLGQPTRDEVLALCSCPARPTYGFFSRSPKSVLISLALPERCICVLGKIPFFSG